MKKLAERHIQAECVTWLKNEWLDLQDASEKERSHARKLIFAVKNEDGGKSDARKRSQDKRMGLTAGVSDLILACPLLVYDCPESILFIEFKEPNKGRQSLAQIDFEASAKHFMRKYMIFDDIEKFKDFFTNHVKLNNYESRR